MKNFTVTNRIRSLVSRAPSLLAGQRRLLMETQQLLAKHAAWLEPGDWVPVSPQYKVWHHAEAALAREVAGDNVKDFIRPESAGGKSSHAHKIKVLILGAAHRLRCLGKLNSTAVPDIKPRRGNATVVIRANQQEGRAELIALEGRARRALRLAQAGTYHQGYVEVRHRLERYLPAPGFSVTDDGAVVVEDWCDGTVLQGLPVKTQVSVTLKVLARYVALVSHEKVADGGIIWSALPRLLDTVAVPAALRGPLEEQRVRCLLGSGMLVPSQGDQSTLNIFIADQGSSWQVLDFDGAAWLPIWWDPIGLVSGLPRYAGELNEGQRRYLTLGLDRIWAAAGLGATLGLTGKHWAALGAVRKAWIKSTKASYLRGNDRFTEPEADGFARHLHEETQKFMAELITS